MKHKKKNLEEPRPVIKNGRTKIYQRPIYKKKKKWLKMAEQKKRKT